MLRWFEQNGKDSDVVISSRVRLARNLSKYNFSLKLDNKSARTMTDKAINAIKATIDMNEYTDYDFKNLDKYQKIAMKERHLISDFLLGQQVAAGFASLNENMSIMINEEDHIRIQSYSAGKDMQTAYKQADDMDNKIGEVLDYAYDEKYGYLTTCPSNVGTGMRASYMLHLPALSGSERISGISAEVGRFGLQLKGVYSDGNGKFAGDIYQLSNIITLGKSEAEIIENLNKIAEQVIAQERVVRKEYIKKKYMTALDSVSRSYGVLKYAKKISLSDGMFLLSQLRFGLSEGLLTDSSGMNTSIYQLMIGIQPANLKIMNEKDLSEEELDISRSQFIRDNLPMVQ